MSETDATYPKSVQDTAAEVMRWLWESLREPAFARGLVLLISSKGNFWSDCERTAKRRPAGNWRFL